MPEEIEKTVKIPTLSSLEHVKRSPEISILACTTPYSAQKPEKGGSS